MVSFKSLFNRSSNKSQSNSQTNVSENKGNLFLEYIKYLEIINKEYNEGIDPIIKTFKEIDEEISNKKDPVELFKYIKNNHYWRINARGWKSRNRALELVNMLEKIKRINQEMISRPEISKNMDNGTLDRIQASQNTIEYYIRDFTRLENYIITILKNIDNISKEIETMQKVRENIIKSIEIIDKQQKSNNIENIRKNLEKLKEEIDSMIYKEIEEKIKNPIHYILNNGKTASLDIPNGYNITGFSRFINSLKVEAERYYRTFGMMLSPNPKNKALNYAIKNVSYISEIKLNIENAKNKIDNLLKVVNNDELKRELSYLRSDLESSETMMNNIIQKRNDPNIKNHIGSLSRFLQQTLDRINNKIIDIAKKNKSDQKIIKQIHQIGDEISVARQKLENIGNI